MDDLCAFENGHFEWNNSLNELQFISHDHEIEKNDINTPVKQIHQESEIVTDSYEIGFKDDIDLVDKLKFRKKYRRKISLNDPTVILLQDVKDVTLFTANAKNLTFEFVRFLHSPMVDRFFRSLIIYFQFYFQTWEALKYRRKEKEYKITQPIVTVLENTVRDDLSDLRSIFAREYFSLLIGSDDASEFHHSQSAMSMSERDRRLCEMLIRFSSRLVWYALNKPSLSMIEQEIDRLSRSDFFNKFNHRHSRLKKSVDYYTENEKRILTGSTNVRQMRLMTNTPVGNEIMRGFHDHRILAIGQTDFPPDDERLRFMEKLYLLPEEKLMANNICLGILGMPRDNFDVMLKPKRKKTHADEEEVPTELVFHCKIPSRIEYSDDAIPWRYPTTPPRIKVNTRKKILREQRNIWMERIRAAYANLDNASLRDFNMDSCASILL